MTVTYELQPGAPLTPEQIRRLDALEDRPIVYDEDCPPSTPEQLERFRRAAHERNRRLREKAGA